MVPGAVKSFRGELASEGPNVLPGLKLSITDDHCTFEFPPFEGVPSTPPPDLRVFAHICLNIMATALHHTIARFQSEGKSRSVHFGVFFATHRRLTREADEAPEALIAFLDGRLPQTPAKDTHDFQGPPIKRRKISQAQPAATAPQDEDAFIAPVVSETTPPHKGRQAGLTNAPESPPTASDSGEWLTLARVDVSMVRSKCQANQSGYILMSKAGFSEEP